MSAQPTPQIDPAAAEHLSAFLTAVVTDAVRNVAPVGEGARSDRLGVKKNEAARRLGVSRSSVDKLIGAGELDTYKVGSSTIVTVASLEALVERGGAPDLADDGGAQ